MLKEFPPELGHYQVDKAGVTGLDSGCSHVSVLLSCRKAMSSNW